MSGTWFLVVVSAATTTLQSIAITTPATKLSYNIGDSLYLTVLVITGIYNDGSTKPVSITAASVTGFNSAAAATDQVLTISVNGKTVTYKVQIHTNPLEETPNPGEFTQIIGSDVKSTSLLHTAAPWTGTAVRQRTGNNYRYYPSATFTAPFA